MKSITLGSERVRSESVPRDAQQATLCLILSHTAGSLQGPREQVVTKVPRGGGEVEQPAPPNENGHVVAPSETAALKIQRYSTTQ